MTKSIKDQQTYMISDFKLQKYIGRGSFGKVYKAKYIKTNEIFAAKVSIGKLSEDDEDFLKKLSREVDIISKLNHPGVLKFVYFSPTDFKGEPYPVIITELVQNGTLGDLIKYSLEHPLSTKFNDTRRLMIIYGIASAMSYLHSHNILHRDLKPDNILLDNFLFPKIADFGLSKIDNILSKTIDGTIGTPCYMAPEIFKSQEYSEFSDVYAFGIILFEMMTKEKPYSDFKGLPIILMSNVKDGKRPILNEKVPEIYSKLIRRCWSQKKEDRPKFSEIVKELRNEKEFILPTVDEEEFLKYVRFIDEHEISFESEKKVFYFQKDINDEIDNFDEITHILSKENECFSFKEIMDLEKECKKAVLECEKDSPKEFEIAKSLIEGKNNFPHNTQVGLHYLKKQIIKGNEEAAVYYCNMLIEGKMIPKDYDKAEKIAIKKIGEKSDNYYLMIGKIERKKKNFAKAKECFERLIQKNNSNAIYEYGKIIEEEEKATKNNDHKKSLKTYKLGIEKGNVKCMFRYGKNLKENLESQDNEKIEAVNYIKMSADKGYAKAMYYYSNMLKEGDCVSIDKVKSREYLKLASDQYHIESMYEYGIELSNEKENFNKAGILFKRGSDRGHIPSVYQYGRWLYLTGDENKQAESNYYLNISIINGHKPAIIFYMAMNSDFKHFNDNYNWFSTTYLADKNINDYYEQEIQNGNKEIVIEYIKYLFKNHETEEKAIQICKQAIKDGNADAMDFYGFQLQDGSDDPEKINEAIKFYKKAIEKGCVSAMFHYGDYLLNIKKTNIKEEAELGVEYLKKAIQANNVKAMTRLAIYLLRENKSTYNEEAVELLNTAVNNGDQESMKVYAEILETGKGTPVDLDRAAELYRRYINSDKNGDVNDLIICVTHYITLFTKELNKNKIVFDEKLANKIKEACIMCDPFKYVIDIHDFKKAINKIFKKNIDKGNLCAIYQYAFLKEQEYCLFDGGKDVHEALKYYKIAADKGCVEAMLDCGRLYDKGDLYQVIKHNKKEAFKYYKMAMDAGSADACYIYGNWYEYEGEEIMNKFKELYKESLKKQPNVAYKYALFLLMHKKIRTKEFLKAINKAIDEGDTKAMIMYGDLIKSKEIILDYNSDPDFTSAKYYKMAADKGDTEGIYKFSLNFNRERRFSYLKKAADNGNVDAMLNLAVALRQSNGIKRNKKEEMKYYNMAFDKGSFKAKQDYSLFHFSEINAEQTNIRARQIEATGNLLQFESYTFNRANLPEEYQEIFKSFKSVPIECYKRGIELGNANCMIRLACLLRYGEGIPKNLEKAAKLYQQAARLGSPLGFAYCGYIFLVGEGVEIDIYKSEEYFKQARKLMKIDDEYFNKLYLPVEITEEGLSVSLYLHNVIKIGCGNKNEEEEEDINDDDDDDDDDDDESDNDNKNVQRKSKKINDKISMEYLNGLMNNEYKEEEDYYYVEEEDEEYEYQEEYKYITYKTKTTRKKKLTIEDLEKWNDTGDWEQSFKDQMNDIDDIDDMVLSDEIEENDDDNNEDEENDYNDNDNDDNEEYEISDDNEEHKICEDDLEYKGNDDNEEPKVSEDDLEYEGNDDNEKHKICEYDLEYEGNDDNEEEDNDDN